MSTIHFPQNGFPEELASIPAGQIFILTNPHLGITSDNITHIQGIFSIAKSVNKRKDVIVNALPGEWSELMGCYVCKVGQEVLLADNDTLVEMLCEFWGLSYDEVCKTLKIAGRNSDGRKAITFGGDTHPLRVAVPAKKPDDTKEEPDFSISLGCYTTHTREKTMEMMERACLENFSYEQNITWEEVKEIFEAAQKKVRKYTLDIDIEKKRVCVEGSRPVKKITRCDVFLTDDLGNKYPIKLHAECKAIYLTYILIKEGLAYSDIKYNKEFYSYYSHIYKQIPNALSRPKKYDLEKDSDLKTFSNFISQTRKAILNATNDTHCEEMFAIEGYKKDVFRVAGATNELRHKIKDEFGLI